MKEVLLVMFWNKWHGRDNRRPCKWVQDLKSKGNWKTFSFFYAFFRPDGSRLEDDKNIMCVHLSRDKLIYSWRNLRDILDTLKKKRLTSSNVCGSKTTYCVFCPGNQIWCAAVFWISFLLWVEVSWKLFQKEKLFGLWVKNDILRVLPKNSNLVDVECFFFEEISFCSETKWVQRIVATDLLGKVKMAYRRRFLLRMQQTDFYFAYSQFDRASPEFSNRHRTCFVSIMMSCVAWIFLSENEIGT